MKDIWKIVRFSGRLKKYYLATMVFAIIGAIITQIQPFLLKFVVDAIVKNLQGGSVPAAFFALMVALIFITGVAYTIITNIGGYLGDQLSAKLNSFLSERYYNHVLQLPLEYYDNEIAGRVTSRLERSIVTISNLIQAFANNFLGFFLTTFFTLIILAYYSWPVAVLLGALFPIYIWLTTLSSRSWQKHQEFINKDTDYANGRFIEAISQIRVVKSFVRELAEFKLFEGKRRDIEGRTRVQSKQWHWYDIARRLSLNVVFAMIYGFIIWETFKGNYSLGTMTLMIQLATQAQFPLFASSFIVDQIQRAQSGSKDYFEVMNTKPSIQDRQDAKELEVSDGKIEYIDVDFAYSEGQPVLNKISFTVNPDSKVALVGESGQGKTTIANLLLRFYETTGGDILIDGTSVKQVTQASLRKSIGVVFQEPALFSGTVKENITYGLDKASENEVEAAAKAANAHDFIVKLPKGYNTEIGERGVKLSGGQKQRIAIARALMKNPPILILDEATSSLDSKAEREVQAALEILMKGRTTMIIAHRLSTIAGVDLIVGLEDGKIAEIGSPEELADAGGIYSELLSLQQAHSTKKLKQYDIAR